MGHVKPFFSRKEADVVVDAVCKCGHLQREHGSKTKLVCGTFVRESGAGNCCESLCECLQFTWARWITATELAKKVVAKRSVPAKKSKA